MSLFNNIVLALGISQLFLFFIYTLIYYRQSMLGKLLALLMFSLICFLFGNSISQIPHEQMSMAVLILDVVLNRFDEVAAVLLLIISSYLLKDENILNKFTPVIWLAVAFVIGLRVLGSFYSNLGMELDSLQLTLTYTIPEVVKIGFIICALNWTVKAYNSEKELSHKKERVIFISGISSLLAVIGINSSYSVIRCYLDMEKVIPIPEVTYVVIVYGMTTFLLLGKFNILDNIVEDNPGNNKKGFPNVSGNSSDKVKKSDEKLIQRIKQAMEVDKLYAKPHLTIAELASHVSNHEYRVRRVINNILGFRNFSDFLNYYRISETSRLLLETDEPVSNVGLDVGYSSLSSFYKAFRERYMLTPKEYRAIGKSRS